MSRFTPIVDGSLPAACGVADRFSLKRVSLGTDVLAEVGAYLSERGYQRPLLVADDRTYAVAGQAVMASLLGAGFREDRLILPDPAPGECPCADDGTIAFCESASRDHDCLVSVGAGTVNDVVKMAAYKLGLPFVTVPTAASMNGYTSAIAAVLSQGVKRTLTTGQVEAVFADVDVLAAAPMPMTLAGFGDLVSKPYSNACWYVASVVTGAPRTDAPSLLLDAPFRELMEKAGGLATQEPDALTALAETLLLSGCSMALAGTSSPASGGEHLISHYWDMVEHASHRPTRAFHGTQVGIGTLVSGTLYEELVAQEAPFADVDALLKTHPVNLESFRGEVASRHPLLPPEIRAEVIEEALKKALPLSEQRARLEMLRERWPEMRAALREMLLPVHMVEDALRAAGAPVRAQEIGVGDETLRSTVQICKDMRSRYTVFDLASDADLLTGFSSRLGIDYLLSN